MMKFLIWIVALSSFYELTLALPAQSDDVNAVDSPFLSNVGVTPYTACLNLTSTFSNIAITIIDAKEFYNNATSTVMSDFSQMIECNSVDCVKESWETVKENFDTLGPQIDTLYSEFKTYMEIVDDNWGTCFGE